MKLIDLLRQELPKRGGWPEGANCINQGWDGRLEKYAEDDQSYDLEMETIFPLTTNHRVESKSVHECGADFVTREQYEAALAATQQLVWDGTGLPPVGCECEHCSYSGVVTVVQIIAHFKNRAAMVAVYIPVEGDMKQVQQSVADCFRPLRTEAERAIDEMVRLSGVSTGAAKILYDAGYRK